MLSMKAKYALRAMMVLASHEGKMMQSKPIAKEADAPIKFLEAILQELKQFGIVESKRGIFGGYFLSRPATEVSAGDIIRIIDGTFAPIRCASQHSYQKCDDCTDENTCVIRSVMTEVRNAIASVLEYKSLADLVAEEKANKHLLGKGVKALPEGYVPLT